MNYKNTLLRVALLCVFICGCTTMGNKKLDDVNSYLQLKEQKSTKLNVYEIFGQPHDVRKIESGDVVWVYYKIYVRPSAWTYVPFVGLAAGGSARDTTFTYFVFDSSAILQKINAKSDKDYENMWAGLGRNISNASDKTQAQRVQDEMTALELPFDQDIAKSVSALRDE